MLSGFSARGKLNAAAFDHLERSMEKKPGFL